MQISIALSGGGAAGLGHIPVLEALDDLDLRPAAIAGTSVGAVIGSAYAAGMTGRDLRAHALALAKLPLAEAMRFIWNTPGALSEFSGPLPSRRAVEFVWPDGLPDRIEDLPIPVTAVATDFHGRKPEYFRTGALIEILAASVAIPGVFRPVRIGERVYVDGGVANNLPLDALPETEITLAVDVASEPEVDSTEIPGAMETAMGSMRIMMHALLRHQVAARPGVIVIEPASRSYGMLDFRKVGKILEVSEPVRDETKRALDRALSAAS